MDDQQTREMLTRMVTSLDADAEYEMRHDNFVAEIPQSSERIRGRANMRSIQRAFPPDRPIASTVHTSPLPVIRRTWKVGVNYGAEVYFVVCVFEFRDGRIARETRYYPQPFEAPEWRAQWVEHIDDADAPKPPPS